jgi:flagellar FliL protein
MKRLLTTLLLCNALASTPLLASGGGGSAGTSPYLALEPAIVVNLNTAGKVRFMQVRVQAMSRDPAVLAALQTHTGPVRHALITLLSAQTVDNMYDVQVREQVRQQALEELRGVLETHAGLKREGLEALYFTDFVIQ